MISEFDVKNRRYIGSKAKLRNWISSTIRKECKTGGSFADIFAGTGIISASISKDFKHLILNDILHSNYTCYQAFFGKGKFDINKIRNIIEKYNKIDPVKIKDNYFSKNFAKKYFSRDASRLIGHIREDIENRKTKITPKEYYILLTSLIYSIDRIANTVGHYDAYIKKDPRYKKLILGIIRPLSVKKISIYRQDANLLTKNIYADTIYIDPPYNSRQYNRFYHLLETLTKWNKAELHGVALKPKAENSSEYCKTNAPQVFKDLIDKLQCDNVVVSYNNTYNSKSKSSKNKIQLEKIEEILKSKGKTKVFKKNYRFFNSGNTNFKNHQEYLFVTNT